MTHSINPTEIDRLLDQIALGAAGGAATGGARGAAIGAAQPLLLRGLQRLRERRREPIEEAARTTGLSEEELFDRILADDRLFSLLQRITLASGRASFSEKRLVLGRVLAQAVTDDAKVDAADMLARTIDDLEPTHARMLALLRDLAYPTEMRDEQRSEPGPIRETLIRRTLPQTVGLLEGIMALLEGHGLVVTEVVEIPEPDLRSRGRDDDHMVEETGWRITEFGELVLTELEAAVSPATREHFTNPRWRVRDATGERLSMEVEVRDWDEVPEHNPSGVLWPLGRQTAVVTTDASRFPASGWLEVCVRDQSVWSFIYARVGNRSTVTLEAPGERPREVYMTGMHRTAEELGADGALVTTYAAFYWIERPLTSQ